MKTLSKSFSNIQSQNSPRFPNYLQPTETSLTKISNSHSKKNKTSNGRSFIYKQENFRGPCELSGKKKLLKNDSGASLLSLLEKSDPYLIKNKRNNASPAQKNSSYRIYLPEFNCETPKFHGIKTYFANIDPISKNIIGRSNIPQANVSANLKKFEKGDKENTVPCLPMGENEKNQGKKTFNLNENSNYSKKKKMKHIMQDDSKKNIHGNSYQDEEFVYKKPMKPHMKSNIFEEGKPVKTPFKPENHYIQYKPIFILPESQELPPKKKAFRYPHHKRIVEGDSAFWKDFSNQNFDQPNFKKDETKVTNLKYGEYVNWIKQEKASLDKYLKTEALDYSNTSLIRENNKKHFPQSPIFKTNVFLG